MNLNNLQKSLESSGYEVVISDKVLQAAKETGDAAVEMAVDSGGGAKIVVKRRSKEETGSWKYKGKKIPIVCEKLSTKTFRVQLESEKDLELIEKQITEEQI